MKIFDYIILGLFILVLFFLSLETEKLRYEKDEFEQKFIERDQEAHRLKMLIQRDSIIIEGLKKDHLKKIEKLDKMSYNELFNYFSE
jgi:hypothetical protein